MRNLLLAALFLLCACALACSSPAQVARRSIDATTKTIQAAEAGFKTLVPVALDRIVEEERAKRAADLLAAKCPAPDATPACQAVADAAVNRYVARAADFKAKAGKVDAAFGAAYSAVLLAVVVVAEVEAGVRPESGVAGLVGRLAAVVGDVMAAYNAFKLFAGTLGAIPNWLP